MSLFHVQEWFSALFPNAHSMCTAKLLAGISRDQIVVGTLDGTLSILDPGREPEHRQEFSGLAELHLGRPILQLCVDRFLPATFNEPILAALLPTRLLYFRLIQTNESYVCEQVFEHKIPGSPAFNMCQGHFGRSSTVQLCVQSLQGHLLLFEAENRVLQRPIADILHPGPIGYSAVSESILVASGGYLRSLRYVSLTATGTKKVNMDWILPLGDTAIQMAILNGSSADSSAADGRSSSTLQPSILVLCKRVLHCVTHGGNPRFSIRLQTVALCLGVLAHGRDARIPLFIGTSTKTLLFFTDSRLIWSAQLPFAPQLMDTCTFSESLRSLLALLSDDGTVLIGYLGTEPSLFRMPVTEARFIDFEARRKELKEFEESIWRSSHENQGERETQKGMEVSVEMDAQSVAHRAMDGVPSATVTVTLNTSNTRTAELLLHSELYSSKTHITVPANTPQIAAFSLFCNDRPAFSPRSQLLLLSSNALQMAAFSVPLALICREYAAQRQANFKLSLESSPASVDLSTLFPEFIRSQEKTSLGLQPFFSDENAVVSLFISTKTNRYRIQSNSAEFLGTVFVELVARIRRAQPEARLQCPVPLHMFISAIAQHIEAENQCAELEKEACRVSLQLRQVETVFLSKLKANDREHQQSSIGTLINYTYSELVGILDKMNGLNKQLSQDGRRPLRALFDLMHAVLKINDIQLPFDGRILDGTDQRLGERLAQLLSAPEETLSAEFGAAEIGRMLANFCERDGGRLEGIVEEEDEEERKQNEERQLNEAIGRAEVGVDLVSLESGSLPAKQFGENIR